MSNILEKICEDKKIEIEAKWNELINEANILYNKSTSTTQPEEIMEQIQALQSQLSELKKKGKKCCKA